jgi:hypothetical protein
LWLSIFGAYCTFWLSLDNKNSVMRKMNLFLKCGLGLVAISLLLSGINLQHNASAFVEGLTIGLGLVLTIKGFLIERKAALGR